MGSKIPIQPTSRLPTLSLANHQNKTLKRQLSDDNFSSPEKKTKSNNGLNRIKAEAVPKFNAPTRPLRRSVSMASIIVSKRSTLNVPKKSGNIPSNIGSTLNLRRATNATTAITKLKSTKLGNRPPISTNNENINRTSTKRKEEFSGNENIKGKGKRPPWDLKGRLQDMEEVMKKNCVKISDYDSRIASLETENNTLSVNLEETKSCSTSAQEELNELKSLLRNSQIENSNLQEKITEVEKIKCSLERKKNSLESELSLKFDEITNLKESVNQLRNLKECLEAEVSSIKLNLESKVTLVNELEAEKENQDSLIKELNRKLIDGESERRKLHNLVLELKGNIRVFCRVRPFVDEENSGIDIIPHINFTDEKSLELLKVSNLDSSSSMSGLRNRNSNYEFSFDRVFSPEDSQSVVFEEVGQLVQSALDGYNVCIFAYGQTGSGKTYTMEGIYDDENLEGMIPRSVKHVFHSLEHLGERGWDYNIEASFLEIYNETIRDLLVNPKDAKNLNYEIKLIDGKKQHIFVSNLKIVKVESASQVHNLLSVAQKHRAVAATNMNERSSRSHSVFQLRLQGKNSKTNEACEGTLNLVDLAGSERLKDSGSEGARLTETQNINKSLANLGNVIMALGQKQSYIPYRNSKLTHLLQNSLGGNSKTLMFVNVSPLDSSFNETLNSLRFATKVNQCNIGTAVKQVKK